MFGERTLEVRTTDDELGPVDSRAPDGPAIGGGARASMADAVVAAIEAERDRRFLWVPVLMVAGAAGYFALTFEPSGVLIGLATVVAAVAFAVTRGVPVLSLATGIVLAVMLGAALAKVRVVLTESPRLASTLRDVSVRGHVLLVEPRAGTTTRVTVVVSALGDLSAEALPARVRVRFAKGGDGLKPGDAIRFRATLSPPGAPVLPGDYDFARAAWFKRLGAVGFATAEPTADASPAPVPLALRLWAPVEQVRQAIGQRITAALAGERGAIAAALITGERGGISAATNTAYRDAGIYHILSISGLHMTIMAGAVFVTVRFMLALVPALALSFPIKKWAAVAAIIGALGYLLISGGEFATVRSYITITVMLFAVLVDRPAIALRNVAISALVILLVWPESVLDVGFQMSFAAVVTLVATYEVIRGRWSDEDRRGSRGWWVLRWAALLVCGIVLTTVVASLAVAPFAAFHFHKSQQYAVLANLIAVPICNFLVMPAALATLVAMPLGIEAGPLWVMAFGIDAMGWSARLVAALPGAVMPLAAIPMAAFALIVAGGLWLSLWRGRRRFIGLIAIAAGLALAPTLEKPDLMVGRDGRLVAVRLPSGRLSAVDGRGARFELARWLEHDGDAREPVQAAQAEGFRCDTQGCTAEVRGKLVAVVRHVSALATDCVRAAVVVSQLTTSARCDGPELVVERLAVKAAGSHIVHIGADGMRVLTVAAVRGDRPWAVARPGRRDAIKARRDGFRLDRFSSPLDLSEPRPQPEAETRPEVEGW